MNGPRRRRTPDPARPGRVYRSKPQLRRQGGLSAGPPYLTGGPLSGTGAAGTGVAGTGTAAPSAADPYAADPYAAGPFAAGPYAAGPYRQGPPAADGYAADPSGAGRPGVAAPPSRTPPSPPSGRQGAYPPAGSPPARRRPRIRARRVVLVLVLLLIGYPLVLGVIAWTSLNRVDALDPAHQAADTPDTSGRTFLVVGSDSRADLSAAERKRLGTGTVAGQRTDTIMLLHVPSFGGPTVLVSVPRDSYLPIPGHGSNKVNAAYGFGGPALLVRTLEKATGLRIDEYVETGLGGFANVVDAVGGVTLCPKRAMNDRDAHINLKAGCQEMDGTTALGYARARKSDPRGDLGRVERQRETLAAIAGKTLSPVTLVQPWRAFPAAHAGGDALTVDQGTTPIGLARFVLAMRAVAGGGGVSLTVPVGNANLSTSAGSAVGWDDAKAKKLFAALQDGDSATLTSLEKEQQKLAGG